MSPSEQQLLSQAIAGDADALTDLLEIHAPMLRRRLHGQIPVRWQSLLNEDDIMQETFVEAFLAIRRFSPVREESLLSWLDRIARNTLVDAIRGLQAEKRRSDQRRQRGPSEEGSEFGLYEILVASGTTPSQHAMRGELAANIRNAIGRLPVTYAQVVELYDLNGISASELAARFGCSEGAIFMRRARGHRLLGELLEKFFCSGS